ncbi:FecR domain-containing protein [Elusimicrobiota bacterium]
MKKTKTVLLAMILFISGSQYLFAAIAKLDSAKGKVLCMKTDATDWVKISAGADLNKGDRIKTFDQGSAKIKFSAGHEAALGSNSIIIINESSMDNTNLKLLLGNIRSKVKKLNNKQAYAVKTPQAVCSVRGTDFDVSVTKTATEVKVFSGLVEAMEMTTGGSVDIGAGQMSKIRNYSKPTTPVDIDIQGTDRGKSSISEEARREMFEEISRDEVMDRASEEVKKAEYENGKALIDVNGNRVRLEEYIVRPEANQFKYVVLNNREERFDFSKILFKFNKDLPSDLTLATSEMFTSEKSDKPEWILTDLVSLMSNTQDQINEEAWEGDMLKDTNSVWKHYFGRYQYSVKGYGKTYSNPKGKILFDQTVVNTNDSYSSLAVTTLYIGPDGNNSTTTVPESESTTPAGADTFHFREKTTYSDGTWLTVDDYLIDDEGDIKTSGDLSDNFAASTIGGKSFKDYLSELNFESKYTSSEFDGRDIDLVFSTKLLLDSGLIAVAYDE